MRAVFFLSPHHLRVHGRASSKKSICRPAADLKPSSLNQGQLPIGNMKFSLQKMAVLWCTVGALVSPLKSAAFALLGPDEPWMEKTNGFKQDSVITPGISVQPADIGGPMDIANEYRWNVPVVTYGFDQSFLNYFGTNGVAAVKSAIQIFNNLPLASQIVLTNFPYAAQGTNYTAQFCSLIDLKSTTLSLLLEQMGLAQPTRHIFSLKQWTPEFLPAPPFYDQNSQNSWISWAVPDYIVWRNFDPQKARPQPLCESKPVFEFYCQWQARCRQFYRHIFSSTWRGTCGG